MFVSEYFAKWHFVKFQHNSKRIERRCDWKKGLNNHEFSVLVSLNAIDVESHYRLVFNRTSIDPTIEEQNLGRGQSPPLALWDGGDRDEQPTEGGGQEWTLK